MAYKNISTRQCVAFMIRKESIQLIFRLPESSEFLFVLKKKVVYYARPTYAGDDNAVYTHFIPEGTI